MGKEKIKSVFNWSGGKDSALALQKILRQEEYEIIALLTTINKESRCSTMHNIPEDLLIQQAESIGIPLYVVGLLPGGNMEGYEEAMEQAVLDLKKQGITHFIFGDICLHEVRKYREDKLVPYGIQVVEPLWGKNSREVMEDFLHSGLQTVVVTIMAEILDHTYIGRTIDHKFIEDLPDGVDICGENGEYHTFCYAGDIFKKPISFSLGNSFFKTYKIGTQEGEKEYSYWLVTINTTKKEII